MGHPNQLHYLKTVGVVDVLRSALAPAITRIKVAFIFGSIAHGTENRASDIDIMVIGKTSFSEIASLTYRAQETLGREINPVVYPASEFKRRIREDHNFVKTVLKDNKIFIIGDEGGLSRLAK